VGLTGLPFLFLRIFYHTKLQTPTLSYQEEQIFIFTTITTAAAAAAAATTSVS
jgi:hypothetical protein